ncbi:MAG: PKD domain-containing protein [Cyclobacteriaceae bacterium]|nr:PKD domain-containing protein [Cyclobacteriaceae bacterium]
MTHVYKLLGAALLILYIMGCKDEDPKLPLPMVDFSTDPEVLEVGKPVTFKNATTNASSYQWNFGDGQTSTQTNPTITFDESGTYEVTLTAFTDDNQRDSVSRNINIGERIMTGISINSIPFVNPEGADWDDATGLPDSTKYPDFILVLGPQDDPSRIIATPPLVDLAPFELPIGFTINPDGDPYILTNETWELTFIDFDGTDFEDPQDEDFELMEIISFNPVTIPTGTVNEDGEGFVQVSIGTYSVDLFFQIE